MGRREKRLNAIYWFLKSQAGGNIELGREFQGLPMKGHEKIKMLVKTLVLRRSLDTPQSTSHRQMEIQN